MDDGCWIEEANDNPLDRTLFAELWVFAQESLAGKRRAIPPDAERCLDDLPEGTLVLTDIPMNQMGYGLVGECHRRYPGDRERAEGVFKSFMWRYWAMQKAHQDGLIRDFIRNGQEGPEIHASILYAAAECPLRHDSVDFDATLLDRARCVQAEEEGD